MKTTYIALLAVVVALSACKREEVYPDAAQEAAAATESSSPDGFTSVDEAQPEPAPAVQEDVTFTAPGKLPAEDTDEDPKAAEVLRTGTDTINNDDTPVTNVIKGHLYSTHDKYHQVTCWYMWGNSGDWALSCLPDSQVANVKE